VETVVGLAVWLFIATNLDTLVAISAFCADNHYRLREVFIGHYVSFCVGLAAAVGGAFLAAELLESWTFLLGFVPLSLGLWGLFRQPPEESVAASPVVSNTVGRTGVVAVTGLGLTGENIAVYIPFFADLSLHELGLVVGIYLVGAGVVFLFGLLLVYQVATDGISQKLDRWLVPTVLVIIGSYVIVSGLIVR